MWLIETRAIVAFIDFEGWVHIRCESTATQDRILGMGGADVIYCCGWSCLSWNWMDTTKNGV